MSFEVTQVASHQASLSQIVLCPAGSDEQIPAARGDGYAVLRCVRKADVSVDRLPHVMHSRGTSETDQLHPESLADLGQMFFFNIQVLL